MPDEILFRPSPKQFEAWQYLTDSETTELGYGGAAHGGKSYLGGFWLLAMALTYPGTGWLMGRRELLNLKRTTLLTFFKVCRDYGIEPDVHFTYNQQQNIITFKNDSQVFLFDLGYQPSDPLFTRLGGLELTGAFVDESNETPFAAIDVLQTRLGRRKNAEFGLVPKLLEGFNPDKGHVYTRYYKPWRDGVLPKHRRFVKALPADNPHTTEAYLTQLRNADVVTRERLLFGNFEYDDDPSALLSYDSIIDLFTTTAEESTEKFLVCDAARFGGDYIVIYLWKGFRVYRTEVYRNQGLDKTREIIRALLASERIPFSHAIIDENGVGGGLVDDLKGVKGFVAQSRPLEPKKKKPPGTPLEQYENLKTQCSYLLADAINKHQISFTPETVILPPDLTRARFNEMLVEDLEQLKRRDADKEGKLKIVQKDEVKEKLNGRSPDFGDTLMMRMWFELAPPPSGSNATPTLGLVKRLPGMPRSV